MATPKEWLKRLEEGDLDRELLLLYPSGIEEQKERYRKALNSYRSQFGENDSVFLFSAPGRTEIGGNHTDHNNGRVLAGSVDLDVIAIASQTEDNVAEVHSAQYPADRVSLSDLEPKKEELGKSAALLRGVARGLSDRGRSFGGFRAFTDSRVPKGSGVSSSAAFEVLIASIQNHFYNDGALSPMELASIGQFAEREFFGKPCGLMDQAASALGGIAMIDFGKESAPQVTSVPFDFAASGYKLCLVTLGGDHADLTHLYAAIPQRMHRVAQFFEKKHLNEISLTECLSRLKEVRASCGDEATLAALHFLRETQRVPLEAEALKKGDFPRFLSLVTASGHSSFEYLQNVFIPMENADQGAAIALNLAEGILAGRGAARIHGGGFGGTTQNFVPEDLVPRFREEMEAVFGVGSCHVLSIRPVGPVLLGKAESAK